MWDPAEFNAAAEHWPDVELERQIFEDYVRQRSPPNEQASAESSARTPLQIASLFLCCACAQGNEAACRAFQGTYLSVIRNAIARIQPDRQFVDDVAAHVFDKLLVGPDARVTRYAGRGDLSAWLKVVATRAALDARPRSLEHIEEPLPSKAEIVSSMSPESLVFCRTHGQDIADALQRATAALTAKERSTLRLFYADGLNIDEIGALYGVHRATVARWLQSTRAGLDSAVRDELQRKHGLGAAEVGSLIHGARSLLEEKLFSLLGGESSTDLDDIEPH